MLLEKSHKVIASKCGKKNRDVIREGVNIIGKGSKCGKKEIMRLEDENETTIVGKLLKEGRKFCKPDSLENFLVEIYLAFLLLIIWFVFQLKHCTVETFGEKKLKTVWSCLAPPRVKAFCWTASTTSLVGVFSPLLFEAE